VAVFKDCLNQYSNTLTIYLYNELGPQNGPNQKIDVMVLYMTSKNPWAVSHGKSLHSRVKAKRAKDLTIGFLFGFLRFHSLDSSALLDDLENSPVSNILWSKRRLKQSQWSDKIFLKCSTSLCAKDH
jgi:hypothetical protein